MNTVLRMAIVLGATCPAWTGTLLAQNYPVKPVRLVVPNAPGGGSDTVARIAGDRLGAGLGQQFIVENRAGAGGRTAAEFVARAAPDGYTLLLGTGATLITARALYSDLNYDPEKNFVPISLLATTAYLLVVHPSVPVQNTRMLLDLARARAGGLNYASTGGGSPAHLAGELFQAMGKVKMTHVPYKGSAPGTLSVMQGETDLMFSNLVAALPHVASGRARAIGISSAKRSSLAPNVPSLDESGLPGFDVTQIYCIAAPAGTPEAIVKRLNEEIARRIPSPETRKQLEADGTEVAVSSPQEIRALISSEIAKWTRIVRAAGIKAE